MSTMRKSSFKNRMPNASGPCRTAPVRAHTSAAGILFKSAQCASGTLGAVFCKSTGIASVCMMPLPGPGDNARIIGDIDGKAVNVAESRIFEHLPDVSFRVCLTAVCSQKHVQ